MEEKYLQQTTAKPAKPRWESLLHSRKARLILFCLWAAAVLAASFSHGVNRTALLDYNPINGDWQSYNVFRRILAGQAPYTDFANYVGMAPILLNLPFLLGDGSFAASLFATNFTCNLLFSVVVLLVFWLITQNTPASLLASAGFSKFFSLGLAGPVFGSRFGGYLQGLFANLYTPSNSMRMARLFWSFLLVGAFLLFNHFYQRRTGAHFPLPSAPRRRIFSSVLGFLCGLGVVWSNDFGLAAALCASLLMVLLFFLHRPKTGKCALQWFFAALPLGAFTSIFAITCGHPSAYFSFTASVGQYQYFYFNGTGGKALLPYVFSSPRLLLYTLPYAAFLLFCLWRLCRGKLSTRLLLGGFLAACTLAATYAYVLSGSGYNFTEALEGLFWLAVSACLLQGLLWLLHRWENPLHLAAGGLAAALSLGFLGLAARDALASPAPPQGAVYVEALGGYAPYPKALVEAAELTAEEEVFSLYATGLEAVKGQFQPSGYDYVIHALGEDGQHQYLADFLTGQYPFVQTTALGVEGWLATENWYLYRYIARDYQRVLQTEYSWVWQRTENQSLELAAAIHTRQNGSLWEITVTAPGGQNFVADVRIAYDTHFTTAGGAVLSLGRKAAALTVDDPVAPQGQVGCYLPAQSSGINIPVKVVDGVGTALLGPSDPAVSTLFLHAATVECTLPELVP